MERRSIQYLINAAWHSGHEYTAVIMQAMLNRITELDLDEPIITDWHIAKANEDLQFHIEKLTSALIDVAEI